MKPRVAVIDVGSNSIKALVAEAGNAPHTLNCLYQQTLEVRIAFQFTPLSSTCDCDLK